MEINIGFFILLTISIALGVFWGTHFRQVNHILLSIFSTFLTPVIIGLLILIVAILYIVLPENLRGLLTVFLIIGVIGFIKELPLYQKYSKTKYHTMLKKYTSDVKLTPKVLFIIIAMVFGTPIIVGLLIGIIDKFSR
jgi:hypothetical protein